MRAVRAVSWREMKEATRTEVPLMFPPATTPEPTLAPAVLYALLPGPTRRRSRTAYRYRLTYRNPEPQEPGCALLWEVEGGRQGYQIALEREESGGLRYHCTCPDAIYRGEDAPHVCKHVKGLVSLGRRPVPPPLPADGAIEE
jgi:hypothetical protein